MGCVSSIKVNLHAVIGTGEYAVRCVVKELLREKWDFNHCTSAGILCTKLIIVIYCVHTLEQSVINCATVFTKVVIIEIRVIVYFHTYFILIFCGICENTSSV